MRNHWLAVGVLAAVFCSGCSDDGTTLPDAAAADMAQADASGDGPPGDTSQPDGPPSPDGFSGAPYSSLLSPPQQVPHVASAALGNALILLNPAEDELQVSLSYSALGGISSARIHLGQAGVNGPALFTLAEQSFVSPLVLRLDAADLTPGGSVASFADAVAALKAGRLYITVNTLGFPSGEIRGQIGGPLLKSRLTSTQVVPQADTAAQADAELQINDTQDEVIVTVNHTGLTSILAIEIHYGGVGDRGDILFNLTGPFTSPAMKLLTSADVTPIPGGPQNMDGAVDALLCGQAYLVIKTATYPDGELRGQIGAARMRAVMSPNQETAAVSSSATGQGYVSLGGDLSEITAIVDVTGLSNITAAHLHSGGRGSDGPINFPLASASFGSPLEVVLSASDLSPAGQVNDFNDAVEVILGGDMYFNVHTQAFAAGELRGQVGRVSLGSGLTGTLEVPPVTSAAGGAVDAVVNGLQESLWLRIQYNNLTNITAAHVHVAAPGANGPVIFPLASGTFTSPFEILRVFGDFTPASGVADTLDQAMDALIIGHGYVNIHTTQFPTGEVRGNLL